MDKQLINVRKAAKIIGVSTFCVYDWVRQEKIPFLKTVGGIRFDPEEIDEWLRRHRDVSEMGIGRTEKVR